MNIAAITPQTRSHFGLNNIGPGREYQRDQSIAQRFVTTAVHQALTLEPAQPERRRHCYWLLVQQTARSPLPNVPLLSDTFFSNVLTIQHT